MSPRPEPSLFSAADIWHAYGAAPVLQGVDLTLRSGEVTALLGGNGSGKSTLVKVMTGIVRPFDGSLAIEGEAVEFHKPTDALDAGIAVVHQHQQLFPDLSVADNVIGIHVRKPRRRPIPLLIDRRAMYERVEAVFEQFGIEVDPRWSVRRLGAAERTFVQVARALLEQPRVLILDEPTASLQPAPAQRVLDLIDRMRSHGVGLLFISHRLGEVVSVADNAVILRDGQVVARQEAPLAEADLAAKIVGPRGIHAHVERRRVSAPGAAGGQPAIAFEAGNRSISVAAGEIVGLAGIPQSGATEAVRRLAGRGGSLKIDREGRSLVIRSPRSSVQASIGFIPEDRTTLGVLGELSVATNLSLPSMGQVSVAGVVRRSLVDERAEQATKGLEIRCPSIHAPAKALSGGNQQKLVVAKWLASGVRVLAIEEPTHGVDIAGKFQVHTLLREFADNGGAIVVASAEPEELVSLCDRIVVFARGEATAELAAGDLAGPAELETLINGVPGAASQVGGNV